MPFFFRTVPFREVLRFCGNSLRIYADALFILAYAFELHDAVDRSMNGVVLGYENVLPRHDACTALADDNGPLTDLLVPIDLNAQILRIAVAPVACTSLTCLMCHDKTPYCDPSCRSRLLTRGILFAVRDLLDLEVRERLTVTAFAVISCL